MSSKVLKNAETRSVVWRTVNPRGASASPSHPPPADGGSEPSDALRRDVEAKMLDLQQQVEAAFKRGVQEGENRARVAFESEIADLQHRVAKSLSDVASVRGRLRQQAEHDLVRLSIEIARRILHRELTVDPNALDALVHSAIQRLNGLDCLRVRVHPSFADRLQQAVRRNDRTRNLEVVVDPSLAPGDFQYETDRGNLDASIEVQLKEIERGFCDRLNIRD